MEKYRSGGDNMGRKRKEREKQISNVEIVIIVLVIVGLLGMYFYMTFLYSSPCASPPNLFVCSLDINKTSEGWVIKMHGWLEIYNQFTGKYRKNYNVSLFNLYYSVYNSSSHFYYEDGYLSYIKNNTSPHGIIFHDVDSNNLLSDGDYMFIPMLKNSSNYIHSGDFVEFLYNGYITPTNTETEDVKLP